ncbi:Homeobox-leucine zipper protein PROTODERMAL FACTOR 2 [Acorus gramineus]|uniref:Homeobox-leucine zipper protein PROTODERMAL FACTOR 2 n=1 Tax=Acorus gramineus TaxID=55184 RepID=A0AAV9ACI0_ACOGR|nr:Homeobox-leucine zipper protein PROTODERMAL FACTOR 2 [Acorus gramineus]
MKWGMEDHGNMNINLEEDVEKGVNLELKITCEVINTHSDSVETDSHTPSSCNKQKKFLHHSKAQIEALETFFKECPHPNEKQRIELGQRIGLDTTKVKYWFQNRRTSRIARKEWHENKILREENEKMKMENMVTLDVLGNPMCPRCLSEDMKMEQLKMENIRLKEELARVKAHLEEVSGQPGPNLAKGP